MQRMNGPHIIELGVYGSLDINTSHIAQKWVAIHTYKRVLQGCFQKFFLYYIPPVFKRSCDWNLTYLGLLDSSRRDESNDSKFAFLASILTEILLKTHFTIRYL